ncbi:prepilin peptidase-dependent protein [Symbiopectobacterium purcellii]|uniref:Prepilin peptidase-dependent protein n=1 Tax=Symbiopectobacterium purcellii TaxID=2871826 RepID=A0ABX9AJH3_9ENTR|nr:prepilin peptidase-dependent protein [Symbiopectobacterium purcellii]QZN95327.1 prepilin peptidase-dependent protein [Symbiopectobacterium purcellii]
MQRYAASFRHSALLSRRVGGFSLMEVLLAMLVGCVMVIGSMQIYPTLHRHSQNTLRHFWLEQRIHQALFALEKDLRRAGFCTSRCQDNVVTLGQFPGETANSCAIVAYDFNRRGGAPQRRETFGYRLRAGAWETQVSIVDCGGGGWERRLDPQEVTVTRFEVIAWRNVTGLALYEVHLAGHWFRRPDIARHTVRWIAGHNA